MRWSENTELVGHVRIRCKFLLFPKCINGKCRWLEFARWEEECKLASDWTSYWVPIKWIND